MGYLNLSSSLRYGPSGKRRKTKAFTTKSKRTIYNELVATQQRQYDKVVKEVAQQYPSFVSHNPTCLLYTSPSPRDRSISRMPSSA